MSVLTHRSLPSRAMAGLCMLLLLAALLLKPQQAFAQSETRTQNGYTMIFTINDPAFPATLKENMFRTFFTTYPQMGNRFNPNHRKTVTHVIDPNYTGVAYAGGGQIVYGASYMKSHQQDYDVVTHEGFHIVQSYTGSGNPGWLVEGLADWARYIYGVNNAAAGWSLPAYSSSQHYTNAYRVTARFLAWLEPRYPTLLGELDRNMRAGTYSANIWVNVTGNTVDQLWTMYGQNPTLPPRTTPTPGGATATRTPTTGGPTATRTSTPPPTGGSNLALGKAASSSATCNTNEVAARAVDGSTTTKWCDNSSATKWLQVDLGASVSVGSFTIRHAGAGGESTAWNSRAFNIQTSTDNATWTTVVNVTANTASISTHPIAARSARYVRLNVTQAEQSSNTAARIYELEVYGGGTAPTATSGTGCGTVNKALNRPATSSSNENTGTTPNLAFDGNTGTRWSSAASDPQWIRVDLGSTQSICRVQLLWEAAYGRSYQIQTSNDGATWTTIYSTTTGDGGTDNLTVSGSGRYVRMSGTVRATSWGYSLWEMQVY